MHKNVEILIGRLATDPVLRGRFAEQPLRFLRDLAAQGFELTPVEIDALSSTDARVLNEFAASLDPRLRKAAPSNPTSLTSHHNNDKENQQ